MLTMVDLNEHSQCHLQVLVGNIEVGVISYSGLALQVITAGNGYQTQKQSPSIGVFRVLNSNEITACSITILGVPLVFSS